MAHTPVVAGGEGASLSVVSRLPNSAAAGAAWELALDLFFESWRISDRWSPAVSMRFRRQALSLSRLIGVAALSRAPAIVEIHLSSARQGLADLEAELEHGLSLFGRTSPHLPDWIGWSTQLGSQLSRWRLELLDRKSASD